VRELVGGAYGRDQRAMPGVNGFAAVDASLPLDLKVCTGVAPRAPSSGKTSLYKLSLMYSNVF
jgi:hypothetical protein